MSHTFPLWEPNKAHWLKMDPNPYAGKTDKRQNMAVVTSNPSVTVSLYFFSGYPIRNLCSLQSPLSPAVNTKLCPTHQVGPNPISTITCQNTIGLRKKNTLDLWKFLMSHSITQLYPQLIYKTGVIIGLYKNTSPSTITHHMNELWKKLCN